MKLKCKEMKKGVRKQMKLKRKEQKAQMNLDVFVQQSSLSNQIRCQRKGCTKQLPLIVLPVLP